jgi:hypothetical protein
MCPRRKTLFFFSFLGSPRPLLNFDLVLNSFCVFLISSQFCLMNFPTLSLAYLLFLLTVVILLRLHRCYKPFQTVTLGEKLPRLLQYISDVTKVSSILRSFIKCVGQRFQIWLNKTFGRISKITENKSYQVKVQFTLEQTTKAQRRSRGMALLFL